MTYSYEGACNLSASRNEQLNEKKMDYCKSIKKESYIEAMIYFDGIMNLEMDMIKLGWLKPEEMTV